MIIEDIKDIIDGIINSYKKTNIGELIWLILSSLIITLISICCGDNISGILAALTGIICMTLNMYGKASCFVVGMFNCMLVAYIGCKNKFYGIAFLNATYYFMMQAYGLYQWSKYYNNQTMTVKTRKMNRKNMVVVLFICCVETLLSGKILSNIGSKLPYLDAFVNIAGIIAVIMSTRRFREQWLFCAVVNILSILMWGYSVIQGKQNISMVLVNIIYLINSIYGYIRWSKNYELNKSATELPCSG